jgi:hypothetical protein
MKAQIAKGNSAAAVPLDPTLLEPSSLERSPWFRKVDFTFWNGAVATP